MFFCGIICSLLWDVCLLLWGNCFLLYDDVSLLWDYFVLLWDDLFLLWDGRLLLCRRRLLRVDRFQNRIRNHRGCLYGFIWLISKLMSTVFVLLFRPHPFCLALVFKCAGVIHSYIGDHMFAAVQISMTIFNTLSSFFNKMTERVHTCFSIQKQILSTLVAQVFPTVLRKLDINEQLRICCC